MRSRAEESILGELAALAKGGYAEVVFSGINLSSYGRDTGTDLAEIVEKAGGGALFSSEDDLIAAMKTLQHDPEERARQSRAARQAFEDHWREDTVLAAYGAALARAAARSGNKFLQQALEAGALESPMASSLPKYSFAAHQAR